MEVRRGVHRLTRGVVNFYLLEAGGRLTLIDAGAAGDWDVFTGGLAAIGRHRRGPRGRARHARAQRPHRVRRAGAGRRGARCGSTRPTPMSPAARRRRRTRPASAGISSSSSPTAPPGTCSATAGPRSFRSSSSPPSRTARSLDVPGRPRVIHVPGHTPGMSAVYAEDRRALMTGDALVTRNPLTGRRGPQIMPSGLNRDSQQALRSLDVLAAVPARDRSPRARRALGGAGVRGGPPCPSAGRVRSPRGRRRPSSLVGGGFRQGTIFLARKLTVSDSRFHTESDEFGAGERPRETTKESLNAEGCWNRPWNDELGHLRPGGRRARRHPERGGIADDAVGGGVLEDRRDPGRRGRQAAGHHQPGPHRPLDQAPDGQKDWTARHRRQEVDPAGDLRPDPAASSSATPRPTWATR